MSKGPISLLVKARTLTGAVPLAVAGRQVTFTAKPLMPSIDGRATRGLAATRANRWHQVTLPQWQGSVWDACHEFAKAKSLGATANVEFVEPDLQQRWVNQPAPSRATGLAVADCSSVLAQDPRKGPTASEDDWFRDDDHGQFRSALAALARAVPNPPVVRVAHLDTGYDPDHHALPHVLNETLARSFVEDPPRIDAHDTTSGILTQGGHGTGTMSILAGRDPADRAKAIGAAPFVEVVPIRVANRVVLFGNSAVARALDYVYSLCDKDATRVHVVTMSMGGIASQAWAEAINALYERGVFVVTAAGNNFGNFPTHNIVFPARFNRVVAACGVMADGLPYADLDPAARMAGNYGPASKMATAIAAYTPNTPWARLGCKDIVDHDGGGTSAATPQVAAAAAIWIAKNLASWKGYKEGWMRVEAIRRALFVKAKKADEKHFGTGLLQANASLGLVPAASDLKQQKQDTADFSLLRVLTGLGAAAPDRRQRMLELEARQLVETSAVATLVPDPPESGTKQQALAVARALVADPRASQSLREALAPALRAVTVAPPRARARKPAGKATPSAALTRLAVHRPAQSKAMQQEMERKRALMPPVDPPKKRSLRVYAYDPSLGASLETLGINEAVLDVKWEDLDPGPVGEYLEVIDVDPASQACYAPVDLDDPYILHQQGLAPSETDPRFHQQMVYAVASRTIAFFERALGRVALWAPRLERSPGHFAEEYVQRLRIYPHALRAANAYYSPEKKALLLGYFNAGEGDPSENAPGSLVFAALSHDIIAHEVTHGLLDGLHRRYTEATNPDVLAFHEAFADIVALFQHFTLPEALKEQIAHTRGDLGRQSLLGALAVQFGHAIGNYGALRDSIGAYDEQGAWRPHVPTTADYEAATEPHDRGAVLVAAVFDAFLQLYRARTADLIRLATGGTGILGEGAISADLTARLAEEAATIAGHCLEVCIRALDFCPPVDITFGDYLRALVTADRDVAPEDPLGYRVAFVAAFRARGITPTGVRSISAGSLTWEPPPSPLADLSAVIGRLSLDWDLKSRREDAYNASNRNAAIFHQWLVSSTSDDELAMLGLVRNEAPLTMNGEPGHLGRIEVHSVRPARRIGPNRYSRSELIVEITQTWRDDPLDPKIVFRGGCTVVIDLEKAEVLYLVRKRVDHEGRFAEQTAFQASGSLNTLRANYFNDQTSKVETFAALHEAR